MASEVFRPVTDGQCLLRKVDADYSTARNAIDADSVVASPTIGQKYDGNDYTIYRSGFSFDTSGLDDACLIESAVLWFFTGTNIGLGATMAKSGMPTYPHIPAIVGDYNRTLYSGNGGTGSVIGSSLIITLNYTGEGWINKTGNTKFMIMSQNDIDGAAPTANEYASITAGGVSRPKLTIVYTVPTATPAVGNASYSGTKDTFTIATANVSDDGGGYEERGFEYGTSAESTWAVRETGVFTGTGNFSLTISGLQPETTYYGRAFVTNAYGTTYSDEWTSFTTSVSPSYGVHEEENSLPDGHEGDGNGEGIYANSNTICFYISEDDGMTWGQKHGPYTQDQADIEITKLLVRSSGKKKIRFTSNVLTGISASVMVKLDCKAR